MMTLKRTRFAVGVLALASILLSGALAQPASATAAVTCYGGAVPWTYPGSGVVERGPYTASTRCQDINLRTDVGMIFACVVFIDHTDDCNRGNVYQDVGAYWKVIASDVRNGTRFKIRLRDLGADYVATNGQVAY